MADSFKGTNIITLQPGDTNVPYAFRLTVASSSTLNDGALPYNSSLHAFSVTVHRADGSTVGTSGIVIDSSADVNTMILRLGHTSSLTRGLHHIEFIVTASVSGSTTSPMKKEFDFNRLWIVNR